MLTSQDGLANKDASQASDRVLVHVTDTHEDDFIRDQVILRLDIKLPKRLFDQVADINDTIGPIIEAIKTATNEAWNRQA